MSARILEALDAMISGVEEGAADVIARPPTSHARSAEWLEGFAAGLGTLGPTLRGIRAELASLLDGGSTGPRR